MSNREWRFAVGSDTAESVRYAMRIGNRKAPTVAQIGHRSGLG
jgi:hypothetical protein